jgi:hypothetical protein
MSRDPRDMTPAERLAVVERGLDALERCYEAAFDRAERGLVDFSLFEPVKEGIAILRGFRDELREQAT